MPSYSFLEAQPLIRFVEDHREKIIGNTVRGFYSTTYFGDLSSSPVAFALDGFDLVVEYFLYSNLRLHVATPGTVKQDPSLHFVYKDRAYQPTAHLGEDETFPYCGRKITDIEIERFSDAFEINPCTEEVRPAGGDYFRTITVHLDNGAKFYISGMSAAYDGYVSVWDDAN